MALTSKADLVVVMAFVEQTAVHAAMQAGFGAISCEFGISRAAVVCCAAVVCRASPLLDSVSNTSSPSWCTQRISEHEIRASANCIPLTSRISLLATTMCLRQTVRLNQANDVGVIYAGGSQADTLCGETAQELAAILPDYGNVS